MGTRENRRYRRIPLDIPADILINNIDIHKGYLLNISPGDLAMTCDAPAAIGDTVIVFAKDFDILNGRIARLLPDGFAISLMISRKHRMQLTERLFMKANVDYLEGYEDRRTAPRHQTGDQRNLCRLPDGSTLFVKIIDMSVSGAAVDSKKKPTVGTAIRLGQRNGIVVRHTPRGFAIAYDEITTQNDTNTLSIASANQNISRTG